ncbi:hypothetical protein Tcan_09057 [Toxocara canis]|uniref:Uncharacterized protein n=1 Tax=Toxocara canis TaxID=6265 RepID=A0A0B2VDI7_TOXCA|nr:hypothetical protein Tcan_09057 [Toxocara canis]
MPDLCSDYRSAGFLLNEASDHWPIRCVWSGGEMNGTCIPSPLYNASITYVSSSTWRELVRVSNQSFSVYYYIERYLILAYVHRDEPFAILLCKACKDTKSHIIFLSDRWTIQRRSR